MWEAIQRTAQRLERSWSRAGYRREAFPDLALAEVESLLRDPAFGMDAILSALAAAPAWSEQLDPHTQFGEPAVTVHKTERWNLDVYFWLEPVTALHDHRFCGAFGVVHGLTLNSTYAFQASQASPRAVESGRLRQLQSELLRPGSARRILPGSEFIHQVVHLARPTLSIALRTVREPDLPLQREYFPPGLSVPSLQNLSASQHRKLDLIGALMAIQHEQAEALITRMLDAEEEACGFWMLFALLHASGGRPDLAARVLSRTASPIRRLRDEMLACLGSASEWSPFWRLARREPHRLLLALGAALDDAGEIGRLVEDYAGGDPAGAAIPRWLAEMKREGEASVWRARLEQRAGPLARFDPTPRELLLLGGIVSGEDRAGILLRARTDFPETPAEEWERSLDRLRDWAGRVPMLRPFVVRWNGGGARE